MKQELIITLLTLTLGFSAYKNVKQYNDLNDAQKVLSSVQNENAKQSVIIKRYIAPDSTKHAVYTVTLAKTEPEKYQATGGYLDSLVRALNVKVEQIAEMTRVKAVVKDKVKTVVTDSVGYQTYHYKNRWLNAELSTKDSILAYSYNVELVNAKYYKGNWLTGKTWYNDVSLADPNGYIVGVHSFKLPPERTKRIGFGLQAGYHYNPNSLVFEPHIGLGISYNLIRF
jgi:hypothetical protein